MLDRPWWCAPRIGDYEQDVLDLFVLESISDFLVLVRVIRFEGEFPLSDRSVLHPSPIAAIGSASANDTLNRNRFRLPSRHAAASPVEVEVSYRYLERCPGGAHKVQQNVLDS